MADQRSRVEFIFQDPPDACVLPQKPTCDLGFVGTDLLPEHLLLVIPLRFDPFRIELLGDCLDAKTGEIQTEDPADDFRLFFYNPDLSGILIFEVAHRRDKDDAFPLFLFVTRANLLGNIPTVHIVEDSLETHQQFVVFIARVDVLGNRQHSDVMFPQIVDEHGGLRFVPPEAGQVFDNDRVHRPALHLVLDLFNALTVKVHSADVVIVGLPDYPVTMTLGIFLEDLSLVGQ